MSQAEEYELNLSGVGTVQMIASIEHFEFETEAQFIDER